MFTSSHDPDWFTTLDRRAIQLHAQELTQLKMGVDNEIKGRLALITGASGG